VVLKAAFTLAFAGSLQVGEFTSKPGGKDLGHTFWTWVLTKGSIKTRASRRYLEVALPASTTEPFRNGINPEIATRYDNTCPVSAMKPYLASDTHRASHEPLFCNGRYQQLVFTREYVILKLYQLANMAGLEQGMYNRHSFSRGATRLAAEVRISDSEMKTLGRWRCEAYKRYIEYPSQERLALAKCC